MKRIRAWLQEDDSRAMLWELPLIASCVVDADGNPLFRMAEVSMGTFDDWDSSTVAKLGRLINNHVGFLDLEDFDG